MPLRHDPVVPLVLGHRAPHSSCLDSRGWMSQSDSGGCASRADGIDCTSCADSGWGLCVSQSDGGGCAHRIRMVDGGRIPFGRHGCMSQSDAMGCAIPTASLSVLVDAMFGAHILHPLGPNICARPSWCTGVCWGGCAFPQR
jgi:hypothetical protein